MPALPASYSGGLGFDTQWAAQHQRYGERWSRSRPDPMVWSSVLEVELDVPNSSFDLTCRFPIKVCGIPLAALPPQRRAQAQPVPPPLPSAPQQQAMRQPAAEPLPRWQDDVAQGELQQLAQKGLAVQRSDQLAEPSRKDDINDLSGQQFHCAYLADDRPLEQQAQAAQAQQMEFAGPKGASLADPLLDYSDYN